MENLTQKNSKAEARNLESPVGGTAIDHVKTEESADEKNEETSITSLRTKQLKAEGQLVQALEKRIVELVEGQGHRERSSAEDENTPTPLSSLSGVSTPSLPDDDYDNEPGRAGACKGKIQYMERKRDKVHRRLQQTTIEDEASILAKDTLPDQEHAFTWIQIVDHHGPGRAEIIINCPTLKRMIADVIEDWPGHFTPRMKFYYPFVEFIHSWDVLREATSSANPQKPCEAHLSELLDLIERSKVMHYWFAQRGVPKENKITSFRDLDKLFYSGQLVFATLLEQPQVFLVCDSSYFRADQKGFFEVNCWTYDFDGKQFTRVPFFFYIEEFSKSKLVSSLRCYPLEYHADVEGVTKLLQERGSRFRDLCIRTKGHQMFDYDGEMIRYNRHPDDLFGAKYAGDVVMGSIIAQAVGKHGKHRAPTDDMTEEEDDYVQARVLKHKGRVMVDPEAYQLYGLDWPPFQIRRRRPDAWRECDCSRCQNNKKLKGRLKTHYDNVHKDEDGSWPGFEDMQLMICPPRIQGYSLSKKIWVAMYVDNIHDIPAERRRDENAFSKLVLPNTGEWADTKKIISALVEHHTTKELPTGQGVPGKLKDLVEGKGQGLIILLHGFSGVGKTLTAESVAEFTGRPLLKVSVADIGLEPTTVERNFENLFQLASRWEGILLFDEADVLLEMRTDLSSLARNSLVSIFLKILEYYEGILLLTTNRIKAFDWAIQSRVHFSIRFPPMSEEEQKGVLQMFLKDINGHDLDREEINNWIETSFQDNKFSGRQIRNILSAAMVLARAENKRLNSRHLRTLWKKTKEFQDYLDRARIKAEEASMYQ